MMTVVKRYLLLLTICFWGGSIQSYATHIIGADFYYEHLSGSSYRVSVAFYGDCAGQSFSLFPASVPKVELLDRNQLIRTFNLDVEGPGVEVTPVCPSETGNTSCRGGTIQGVTRFIYSGTISIPYTSAGWRFRFNGDMDTLAGGAGRSISINNLTMPATGSIMAMEATLNNLNGNNSSPRFTTLPTPFYCINIPQQYNQGAVDPNGDSLTYSLSSALDRTGVSGYKNGYSPTDPLGPAASGFSFNNQTGQMDFTPTTTQNNVVVNSVAEYRNGQLVGTAMREMTFIVLGTCNNSTPVARIDPDASSFSGGILDTANNIFTVCAGSNTIFFKINAHDPDNDRVTISVNGLPAGATLNITNNNTAAPSLVFNWNLGTAAPGNYNFFITFKDAGCPLSSQRTIAYTVRIVSPNSLVPEIIYPTECAHKAYVKLQFINGNTPRNVEIRQGGNIIRSFTDNTGFYSDSLDAGTYTYSISAPGVPCITNASFTVRDSGIYPYPPRVDTTFYCRGDTAQMLSAVSVPGSSIFWYGAGGARLAQPPLPSTALDGVFTWQASAFYKVCESRKVPYTVFVTTRPVADITVSPDTLCSKEIADVRFTGTNGAGPYLKYLWSWDGGMTLAGRGAGPWKIQWPNGGLKRVSLQVLENQCPSNIVRKDVLVKQSPTARFSASSLCLYDTLDVVYTADPVPGQQYAWSFDGGNILQGNVSTGGPFRIHWPTAGTKELSLVVSKDGCTDTFSRSPVVYEVPKAVILTVPEAICLGDKIYLEHTGAGNYQWTPGTRISRETDGRLYTHVSEPTTYKLTLTNAFGCVDSASIRYDQVEPCCNFSYPNAFTPNNDGKNDVFRVVTYGNDEHFSLSIYNRWGQRVYYSGNAKEGWDGRINGREADAGTYFYVLRAKCLTGHEEQRKGELTLVR